MGKGRSNTGITRMPENMDNGEMALNTTPAAIGSGEILSILIKAATTNSGNAYVGVSGKGDAANGYPLSPGESIGFEIKELGKIYVSSDVNGDKIRYVVIKP